MAFDLETWAREWSTGLGPALEQAIAAVAGQLPTEDIVGVGIATDADATSIVAFANSRSHLAQMITEDPDYAIDCKWHIGEWDLDITGREGFDDPLKSIRASAAHGMKLLMLPDAPAAVVPGLREFRMTVWDSLSCAMTDSVARGFFEQWPDAVRVFLPLDADISERQIAEWNSALNDPAEYDQFRRFLQLDGD
ncbi:DUF4303 domain-containing protein [Stackebrandtia soli]|uniref:DUF4303 domain-containing protein n=1 Tax=Stackebrandtia soli TaxID=1892856 RepID=UPI0039E7CE63